MVRRFNAIFLFKDKETKAQRCTYWSGPWGFPVTKLNLEHIPAVSAGFFSAYDVSIIANILELFP